MQYVEIVDYALVDAPHIITTASGINFSPTDEDYMADPRYYLRVENRPEEKAGYMIVEDGFEIQDKNAIIKYRYDELPKIYRTFSKYKLIIALKKVDQWEDVKSWMQNNDLWDVFQASQDLYEDDDVFRYGLQKYIEYSGKTAEQIEYILSQCVV